MHPTIQRIWVRMAADKRRFGVLLGALLVGLLLWGRIIVVSNPPRRAVAEDQSTEPAAEKSADRANSQYGSDSAAREVVRVYMTDALSRDPFQISRKHFPKPTSESNSGKEVVELESNSVENQRRVRELRAARLAELADKLTLEAVMNGGLAVINGRTFKLGDTFIVGGDVSVRFQLVEVKHRSVIVEADDRRFELSMATGLDQNEGTIWK